MFDFDYQPNRVDEKCRKWDREIIKSKFEYLGEDIIPMWIADMDFKIPKQVEEEFIKAVERGVFGYTYCYNEFYEAVIKWQMDMHGAKVDKEWITLSYGTVSTIHYIIQAFCNVGDNIILNTPVYDPFESAAKKQNVNIITNSLDVINNRYYINFNKLEEQILKNKPKLMLLCTPHNPSGRIWSIEEIKKLATICKDNNVILVADEVHGEHIHYGKFESVLNLEGQLLNNIILLTSPNKAFNLGGLKTSYSIIKSEELRSKFRNKLNQNSITSPNVFGIIGIIAAYNKSRIWLEEVNKYIKKNYELIESYITENLPMIKLMKMESSYLVWMDISKLNISSNEFVLQLAKNTGVLLESGTHFVKDGDGYIRMNIGTQTKNVEIALQRIEKFVKSIN